MKYNDINGLYWLCLKILQEIELNNENKKDKEILKFFIKSVLDLNDSYKNNSSILANDMRSYNNVYHKNDRDILTSFSFILSLNERFPYNFSYLNDYIDKFENLIYYFDIFLKTLISDIDSFQKGGCQLSNIVNTSDIYIVINNFFIFKQTNNQSISLSINWSNFKNLFKDYFKKYLLSVRYSDDVVLYEFIRYLK